MQRISLHQLLKTQHSNNASDLHITVGSPPQLRVNGEMCQVKMEPLTPEDTQALIYSILNEEQKRLFEENKELDFSFALQGLSRFRANIFRQKASVAGVFRLIPHTIKPFDTLGLPGVVSGLCDLERGLVLVTGATGSGKSTTLASMVDKINREKSGHILTIEDPIEFAHEHKRCIINQRELGQDTQSIPRALKSALRQDPDVVLIGELRDLETIQAALTMAETGHLVFATLHTNSAVSTITRIIDVFPAHQQAQVRAQLAVSLQGVLCQQLLPRLGAERGRVLAYELLIPTAGIRTQVREDKLHLIQQSMLMSSEKTGNTTLNQCLMNLIQRKLLAVDAGILASNDRDDLKAGLVRMGLLTKDRADLL